MNVDEIMVRKLETIGSDAPVYDAIEKMVDKRIRSLLVKPKDEKDIPGVVTIRDIVYKVLAKGLDPNKIRIGEIASKPVVTVNKDMDMTHVINLMTKFNITRVFVSNGKDIAGVVSLMDVLSGALIERAKGGRLV
jgi:CBS domain-containing protein